MASFTEAVDKINVALGDEIGGGAEGVAGTIGTLRNVLGDIKSTNVADDLMIIGNALNTLGAAGFATSPVIADFANRIGGVGIPFGTFIWTSTWFVGGFTRVKCINRTWWNCCK